MCSTWYWGESYFVVAVDGRPVDHAQDPARRLGPVGFRGQAVPHAGRVRPPFRRQQVAHVEHEPVVLRVAALEHAVHHEVPDDLQGFLRQPVGPPGDERAAGIYMERSAGRPAAPSICLIRQGSSHDIDDLRVIHARRQVGVQVPEPAAVPLRPVLDYPVGPFVDLLVVGFLVHGSGFQLD